MYEQILVDGYVPIYHVVMERPRFGLDEKAARSEDMAEEYAVCADPKANAGLIVYAKYRGEWYCNPWSTRFLVRDLLEKIGITLPLK